MNEFTLTKQISKQGMQSVIIIPSFLKERLKPKMLVEIKIKILDENVTDSKNTLVIENDS